MDVHALFVFCFKLFEVGRFIAQAHEQLRAVLLSLLEEFPSDLPILLLATSSVLPAEVDTAASSIFSDRSMYVIIYLKTNLYLLI